MFTQRQHQQQHQHQHEQQQQPTLPLIITNINYKTNRSREDAIVAFTKTPMTFPFLAIAANVDGGATMTLLDTMQG